MAAALRAAFRKNLSDPDFIAGFACPLPATVIAGMVGVPDSDLDLFKSWSDDLATFVGRAQAIPDKRQRAERSAVEMTAYFGEVIDHRRHHREHASHRQGIGGDAYG